MPSKAKSAATAGTALPSIPKELIDHFVTGPMSAEAIQDISGGGAHVSIDALGSAVICRNSILCLRKRGRHVQVGLMVGEHSDPSLPMGPVIGRELELLGSHGMQAYRYPEMLQMIVSGKLRPDLLLGKTVTLEASMKELENMGNFGVTGITVIDRF
jgi:alcohol dehydrogenase